MGALSYVIPTWLKDPCRATGQPEAGRGMEPRECESEGRGEERK